VGFETIGLRSMSLLLPLKVIVFDKKLGKRGSALANANALVQSTN
jgi:hypothetical protein